ncbi:hypothetical protein EYC80_003640 [Monilinia laxa]|uniref:Uncharacterized protein n=1 Tax=Monilinia laxa TaxID=61186 RepID=A0A5N6KKJ4_MONLA|nr:hypothetical protein EYC80_003640 [Monilinia laxa]
MILAIMVFLETNHSHNITEILIKELRSARADTLYIAASIATASGGAQFVALPLDVLKKLELAIHRFGEAAIEENVVALRSMRKSSIGDAIGTAIVKPPVT